VRLYAHKQWGAYNQDPPAAAEEGGEEVGGGRWDSGERSEYTH